ncbi:peptidoglycan DD-metalloendopeptidase family protein [Muriicola sp. SD30]|uniref:peptidoglycan DD-metalloendopeptidase family protein n=1 Tax=Muriicola sp. SD30 TaxID=3240936 RepID=UPI00350F36A4
MADFTHILSSIQPGPLLDASIPFREYTPLDLSVDNKALEGIDLSDPPACQEYIDSVLVKNKARVAYGGYLERRNLYSGNEAFSEGEERRDVHLGVDFWTEAGTAVLVPIDGEVQSFRNNAVKGDYGPTIILRHTIKGVVFHSLYGHLSLESLDGLFEGKRFKKGEVLATLGTPEENVNYAPHLHFQLILDIQGMQGDYPGVCLVSEKGFYRANCPDPNHLFSL